MDELEVLAGALPPLHKTVVAGGQTLAITPLRVGQIPGFARAIRPLVPQLGASGTDWFELLAEHGDALIEALRIATGLGRHDLAELPPDEFVELAAAVMEVNADFFVRRLTPALSRAAEGLTGILRPAGAGPTPSKP